MPERLDRRAAHEVVAAYHQVELAALLARVSEAIDLHRAGSMDAFEVDRVIVQYSRAAKKLWTFCDDTRVISLAGFLADNPQIDWWERGAFRSR